MRKVTIKDWPYPKGVKAMLLRIDNPIYDGQGNWHSDVTFRSVYKEYKTIPLAWGLLPMLKTGQVFCDGYQVDHTRSAKREIITFNNAQFEFFTHQFNSNNALIELPCFRTTQNDITYNVTAIEVVRSFFARTRILAYEILQENSLIRLCQCQLNESSKRSITVQLAPECPARLCSEKWLPILAWLSTDKLAQLSWASFFHYYGDLQIDNENGRIPLFPLVGDFSLDCYYRIYGKNIWLDEISNIYSDMLQFDEVLASKYVTEKKVDSNNKKERSSLVSTSQSGNVEIVNTKVASLGSSVEVETELASFIFAKQPKVHITEKILEVSKVSGFGTEEKDNEIEVTGKNMGFTNCGKGIEFASKDDENLLKTEQIDISFTIDLIEASEKDLAYNTTLLKYLIDIRLLEKMSNISHVKTKVYELSGQNLFSWITLGIRRCCVVSRVSTTNGKVVYIIEVDRTIWYSKEKWCIATLILYFDQGNELKLLKKIIESMAEYGHWKEEWFVNSRFQRIRHRTYTNIINWTEKVSNIIVGL